MLVSLYTKMNVPLNVKACQQRDRQNYPVNVQKAFDGVAFIAHYMQETGDNEVRLASSDLHCHLVF